MVDVTSVDVLVAGGGPAGTAAAVTLARAGLDVVVADKARFPREKCCGDGLTTGALRRLERLGLDPRDVPSFAVTEELAVRSPRGRISYLPLARPGGLGAAVSRRRDLDTALLHLARRAGAAVVEGDGIDDLSIDSGGAQAHGRGDLACRARFTSGAEVRARYVVAADGAWSRVRSLLGAGTRAGPRSRQGSGRPGTGDRVLADHWHAYRAYATGISPQARERLWVWFDPELLPGYVWCFPLANGIANIGICLRRRAGVSGRELGAAWRHALEAPFLASLLGREATLESPARSWPIPAGIDRSPLAARDGRVLFVGDAAWAADPFTGEGIAQALETGVLASSAIVALGARSPEAVAARYAAEVRSGIGLEHKMSRALSGLLSRPIGARGAVRIAGSTDTARRLTGRWLYEDVLRTLALTPRRWRPGALRPPAPYPGLSQPARG